jgi:NAD(P)-dependent dehydrogenase (short-subunit alcohol dehydrogenase family)
MSMLNMLVQCTALEVGFHGIRVNAVAPGVTYTDCRRKQESLGKDFDNDKFMVESAHYVPLQEINMPEDIANSILWLASSDASYVTGEILVIDGAQSLTTNKYT